MNKENLTHRQIFYEKSNKVYCDFHVDAKNDYCGPMTHYEKNGLKDIMETYKDDKLNGISKYYLKIKQNPVYKIGTYKNDVIHGIIVELVYI